MEGNLCGPGKQTSFDACLETIKEQRYPGGVTYCSGWYMA
jgi:hypothetical protein